MKSPTIIILIISLFLITGCNLVNSAPDYESGYFQQASSEQSVSVHQPVENMQNSNIITESDTSEVENWVIDEEGLTDYQYSEFGFVLEEFWNSYFSPGEGSAPNNQHAASLTYEGIFKERILARTEKDAAKGYYLVLPRLSSLEYIGYEIDEVNEDGNAVIVEFYFQTPGPYRAIVRYLSDNEVYGYIEREQSEFKLILAYFQGSIYVVGSDSTPLGQVN